MLGVGIFYEYMEILRNCILQLFETYVPLYPLLFTRKQINRPIKVGLLTNEIPPVIYGGVATWIVNFMAMFDGDERYEIIPIFLAYNDKLPEEIKMKYPSLRVIHEKQEIKHTFQDIDICVNNLWIALDSIRYIKEMYPSLNMVTVCHSLIRMENLTNLGSCYTSNFNQQEKTFEVSDYVVLISEAEKEYYDVFHYGQFPAKTRVIYNSYKPKYDNVECDVDYSCNNIGYIGRHVPRKRPELPLMSVTCNQMEDIQVYNMGVDYDKYGNEYWKKLEKEYPEILNVIPFTSDKSVKETYFQNIGIGASTAIYEPFGYTTCELLDRRIPMVVADIDGPKEIIDSVREYVYPYTVDIGDYPSDIQNFTSAFQKVLDTSPEVRKTNAEKARKALDLFRPPMIRKQWIHLFEEIFENNVGS